MAETAGEEAAYGRGQAAGEVAARLAGHDKHFAEINGNISKLIGEVHTLNMNLQRLGDNMSANETKVVATAAALKDAEVARREKTETAWSPFARLMVATGSIVALLSLILGVFIAIRGG